MKKTLTYRLHIFLFLLPALILFIGILIAPIIMSLIYSFCDFSSISGADMKYVGFDNYKTLFSSMLTNPNTGKMFVNDKYMGNALGNALALAVLSVFIQLPLALVIALKLSKGIRGERAYLSIFFMPVLISTVIIGRLWMNIYDPGEGGLLNAALRALGIDKWLFPAISGGIRSSKLPFTGQWTGFRETALIAAFAYGPISGAAVCLVKNLVSLLKTSSGGIGTLCNFCPVILADGKEFVDDALLNTFEYPCTCTSIRCPINKGVTVNLSVKGIGRSLCGNKREGTVNKRMGLDDISLVTLICKRNNL